MLSPSLVSMILHSVWRDADQPRVRADLNSLGEVVRVLRGLTAGGENREPPRVPIVGRSRSGERVQSFLGNHVQVERYDQAFFWGRVPVGPLIEYFERTHDIPSDDEFIDLGTTLRDHAMGGVVAQSCKNLMAKTGSKQPKTVQVVLIDRGEDNSGATPEDFNGQLAHADKTDLRMSDHALNVLYVLLERLDHHTALPVTEMVCALVRRPTSAIGLKCFQHANVNEMLDALKKLKPMLSRSLPVALNMSLGTHCGPHNGVSPLEDFVRTLAPVSSSYYFHASAGNDGMTGVAGRRKLRAGVKDCLKVRTGSNNSGEILIEFWWVDDPKSSFSMEVSASDSAGSPVLGSLRINSKVGAQLSNVGPSFTPSGSGPVICQSLFHARCHKDMNCVAFALSTKSPPGLPMLDVEFSLEDSVDTVVNAWIVVSEDRQSCFIEGSNEGTISVPATDPEVVSVTGIDSNRQPWPRSSRGPGSVYQVGVASHPSTVPYMAHLVELGHLGEVGTSFASPRACADTANIIRDKVKRAHCTSIKNLVNEILAPGGSPLPWNPRTGFGAP